MDGTTSFAGCAPVLLFRVGRSMTMSASEPPWGYKKKREVGAVVG